MHKVLIHLYKWFDVSPKIKKKLVRCITHLLYTCISHIIAIYALIRRWRRKPNDGFTMAKRQANYVTHVMTGQCVIIKSSISCQECALLQGRQSTIMPIPLCRYYCRSPRRRGEWLMTRAGSLQQCLNSRAIVCHWKIHGEKKGKKKASRKRGEKERKREIVESGRHNLAVSENGEKMVRGRFGWRQSQIFFFFFFFWHTRAAFFREKWGKTGRLRQSISLSGTWFCDHY